MNRYAVMREGSNSNAPWVVMDLSDGSVIAPRFPRRRYARRRCRYLNRLVARKAQ